MSLEFFIAKRLASGNESGNRLSRLMSYIAIISIALGIAVMILTIAIVTGFKQQITDKIVGGNSHIQIVNLDANFSFETNPINADLPIISDVKSIKGVKHIQKYVTKGGIIKTDTEIQGIMLKGIDADFDWTFFKDNLIDGNIFSVNDTTTNNVLISKTISDMLRLKTGDRFEVYFVQEPLRVRKFTIAGIYNTQLQELDKMLVLCDIKHLQKIYGWKRNQISGFEISVDNIKDIDPLTEQIADKVIYKTYDDGSRLTITNVMDLYPHLFGWLHLLNTNVWIILILTIAVAGFNMISSLLIMLLERTSMIGILKSLGMKNINIRKLFLYRAGFIVVKGLIFGNIIGLICCFLQQQFGFVKLDATNYFVSIVPININVLHIVLLNICSIIVIMLALIIPSRIITKMSPDKTLKFE